MRLLMSAINVFAVLTLTLTLVSKVQCAKILVLHPLHGGSHKLQMQVLSNHLNGRGHDVTALSFLNVGDAVKPKATNITNYVLTVDNSDGRYPYMTTEAQGRFRFPVELLWKSGHNPHYLPLNAFKMTEALCRALFENEPLLRMFRQEKFDLAIVDVISNECGLAFAYQLGIPSTVAYWALFPVNGEMDYIGSFVPPSYVPTFLSRLSGRRMNFMERLYNTYLRVGGTLVMELQLHLTHKYIQEYFPRMPHPKELIANLSGVLINSDFALDYPKLLPPNAVNVGCLQCRDPFSLPKDLQDFMDNSKYGVIVFSMGASFDATVGMSLVPKLFAAFSRLQERVLMRIASPTALPGVNVPPNVRLVSWFPQQDVLGHDKTRVFFTHCGLHGVLEAIWHAVPMVGMPVFGDQFDVLSRIQERGIGVGIGKDASTQEIYQALFSVLNSTKYQHGIHKLQKLLRDQRDHPMERATWHIEYILRSEGAQHLKLGSRHLNFFQLYCLDVLLTLAALILLGAWLLYKLIILTVSISGKLALLLVAPNFYKEESSHPIRNSSGRSSSSSSSLSSSSHGKGYGKTSHQPRCLVLLDSLTNDKLDTHEVKEEEEEMEEEVLFLEEKRKREEEEVVRREYCTRSCSISNNDNGTHLTHGQHLVRTTIMSGGKSNLPNKKRD